jgi:hypothetical protein
MWLEVLLVLACHTGAPRLGSEQTTDAGYE